MGPRLENGSGTWSVDFQDGDQFQWRHPQYSAANRLIDQDHGQIDAAAHRRATVPIGRQRIRGIIDDFTGINGAVRISGRTCGSQWMRGYSGIETSAVVSEPIGGTAGLVFASATMPRDCGGDRWAYYINRGTSIAAGRGTPTGVLGDYNGKNVVGRRRLHGMAGLADQVK